MTSTLSTPPRDRASPPPAAGTARRSRLWSVLSMSEVRWAALATALFLAGGMCQLLDAPAPVWWALYLACYATGGWEPALSGLQALREKTLDVDILMIVAALLAASIGQVFEGALLIVIFATSGALEAFVTRRTADSVRALLDLAPEQATRLTRSGDEEVVDTASSSSATWSWSGPGERVGADGEVRGGTQRGRPGLDHRRAAAGGQGASATRSSPARSTAPAPSGSW